MLKVFQRFCHRFADARSAPTGAGVEVFSQNPGIALRAKEAGGGEDVLRAGLRAGIVAQKVPKDTLRNVGSLTMRPFGVIARDQRTPSLSMDLNERFI